MPRYQTLCLSLVCFLMACATSLDQSKWSESMRREPLDQGSSRAFPANLDSTLQAAEDALATVGLRQGRDCPPSDAQHPEPRCTERAVTRVGDHTSIIIGFNEGRAWNGVQVRVVMEELATNQITVRVLSKYRMETMVGGKGDYSESILNEIARTLR